MSLVFRRTKMVSIRLTPEEFERFRQLCAEHHVRSISDLARTALEKLAVAKYGADPLSDEVRDLRKQVLSMSRELDRISELVQARHSVAMQANKVASAE